MKDSKVHHTIIAVPSDSLVHDSAFVHCVQKVVTEHIKKNFPLAKKVIYFLDGAAQHFKNKSNFENWMNHKEDFGLEAEWRFDATAHGKNACDGENYLLVKSDLEVRFDGAKTVPGTLSYHSFQVLDTTKQLQLRPFSTYPDADFFPKSQQGEKRKLKSPPKEVCADPSKERRRK
ncbi:hypothetical protein QAD02_015418 [Eretmocerus hayati]|uniref:Uncharacterized protein n=1 Tax=Eretmocerus hayati TaxID=131215 RepID=A0ACC2P9V2_9HYME|nr:hypothetical protein QAD02_015418 [Eretmocerus hayati]